MSRPSHELSELIRELLALMTQGATGDSLAIMAEAELTLPQIVALQALGSGGPRNISAIAALLGLSLPASSQLIERLVRRGLVERSEDAADRRQKRVGITVEGARLIERLGQSRSGEFEAAFASLPGAVQDQLAAALRAAIEQLRQDKPPLGE